MSPAQLVFGRPVRDTVPAHRRSFAPEWQLKDDQIEKTLHPPVSSVPGWRSRANPTPGNKVLGNSRNHRGMRPQPRLPREVSSRPPLPPQSAISTASRPGYAWFSRASNAGAWPSSSCHNWNPRERPTQRTAGESTGNPNEKVKSHPASREPVPGRPVAVFQAAVFYCLNIVAPL